MSHYLLSLEPAPLFFRNRRTQAIKIAAWLADFGSQRFTFCQHPDIQVDFPCFRSKGISPVAVDSFPLDPGM
jgi:hypothetical protein